jgi:hypothetical protein
MVLLDENLDYRLRIMLGGHEVSTVKYMGWMGALARIWIILDNLHSLEKGPFGRRFGLPSCLDAGFRVP